MLFGVLLTLYLVSTANIELLYLRKIDKDRYTIIKKEMKCALDKKREREQAIKELKDTLEKLNIETEKLEKVLNDDTNILSILTKNDQESKDDGSDLVLTI